VNKIIQFHIDSGYYVKVKPLPKLAGCITTFPANKLTAQTETNRTYLINTDPSYIEIFHLEVGKDIISKKIHIDKIAMRLLILEDILLQTLARKISKKLILVEGDADRSVFTILDVALDEEELALEKELCLKFRELLAGKVWYDVANSKFAECYKIVLECFENGGL
jgi:hypothetical protein